MGVSIYYEVRRKEPLSSEEWEAIRDIQQKYSVDDEIRQGGGLNWESFTFYNDLEGHEPSAAEVVLEGSTKLPSNREDAVLVGLRRWCAALTEIRRAVEGGEWRVTVEDHEILWNPDRSEFDPGFA